MSERERFSNGQGAWRRLLLGGFGLLVLALTGCGESPNLGGEKPTDRRSMTLREQLEELQGVGGKIDVPVLRLRPRPIRDELSITGELVPRHSVIVKPLMDGRLSFIRPIKVGDIVSKGEVIAKIDDRDIEDDVQRQEKQIEISTEKLSLSEQELEQKKKDLKFDGELLKEGYLKPLEYERSKLSLEEAEIGLRQSRLTLEQERNALNKALRFREKVPIVAPIDGMVVLASHLTSEERTSGLLSEEITALEGTLVGTASPLFGIVSQDGYLAQCTVNGKDKAKLREGQPAQVLVITHRPIDVKASLSKISLLQDVRSHAYKVWLSLDSMDPSFTSGLFVRANIELARSDRAFAVPREFVKERNNRPFVQLVVNGAVRDVEPTLGILQGDQVELAAGVKAGDLLIASKDVFAADQAVNPVEIKPELVDGEAVKITPAPGLLPLQVNPEAAGDIPLTINAGTTGSLATLTVKLAVADTVNEMRVTLNDGAMLSLPPEPPGAAAHEAVIDIPLDQLHPGENRLRFSLADQPGATPGFAVQGVELLLEK